MNKKENSNSLSAQEKEYFERLIWRLDHIIRALESVQHDRKTDRYDKMERKARFFKMLKYLVCIIAIHFVAYVFWLPQRNSMEIPDYFIPRIKEAALVRRVTLEMYIVDAIMNQTAKDLNS